MLPFREIITISVARASSSFRHCTRNPYWRVTDERPSIRTDFFKGFSHVRDRHGKAVVVLDEEDDCIEHFPLEDLVEEARPVDGLALRIALLTFFVPCMIGVSESRELNDFLGINWRIVRRLLEQKWNDGE